MEYSGMSNAEQRSAERKTSSDAITDTLEMKSCQNAPFRFAMFVCPNNNSRTGKRIFMKLDNGKYY
jgi:uncharacterized protein YlaI